MSAPVHQIGDRVRHKKFGVGTVMEAHDNVDGPQLAFTISFDSLTVGTRTILGNYLSPVPPGDPAYSIPSADIDWPGDTFVFEPAGGEAHGHGGHWTAFPGLHALMDRVERMKSERLLAAAHVTGKHPPRIPPLAWIEGWYHDWPLRTHGLRTIDRIDRVSNHIEIAGAFPFHALGAQLTVDLEQVTVWPNGCEAHVRGTVGGCMVDFYDTEFLVNRGWYKTGQRYDFILTGIAYAARPAPAEEFTVPHDPDLAARIAQMLREQGHEALPDYNPRFSTQGMAALLPVAEGEGDCDDYSFRGPVQSIRDVEILGEVAWLLEVTVLRFSEDINLKILVTRRVWQNDGPPKVGMDVEGRLWLQGYLWLAYSWRDPQGHPGSENPESRPR